MTEARPSSVPSESDGKREAKGNAAEGPCGFPTVRPWGAGEHPAHCRRAECCHGFARISFPAEPCPRHNAEDEPYSQHNRERKGRWNSPTPSGRSCRPSSPSFLRSSQKKPTARCSSASWWVRSCSPDSTHRHRGRHHQRHVHPRGRHRGRCPGHWAYTLHRRQRGHFRVPRDLGHFGGAHQCDGGVSGVRHVGSEEREKPHRRGNSHVRAGRAHLRRRLLQLPDRRIGHAPRHRRAEGVAREAVVPHRRHSSADMHDRARVFVGGSGVRRRRRPGR